MEATVKIITRICLLANISTGIILIIVFTVSAHTKCKTPLPFGGWTEGCPHFHSAPPSESHFPVEPQGRDSRTGKSKNVRLSKKTSVKITMINKHHNTISYKFFNMTNRNKGWGVSSINRNGRQTFNLSCNRGEKICFGAWAGMDNQWGVGAWGKNQCNQCCITCDGKSHVFGPLR